jgi:hypothetical protein
MLWSGLLTLEEKGTRIRTENLMHELYSLPVAIVADRQAQMK